MMEQDIQNIDSGEKKSLSPFLKELIHFIKYSSVSASGAVIQFILFYFLIKLVNTIIPGNEKLADGLTTAFCYFVGHVFQFIINKLFVFKSHKNPWVETLKYCAITIPKMLITSLLVPFIWVKLQSSVSTLINSWTTNPDTILKLTSFVKTVINALVQIVLFFAGYILQKIWVFRKDKIEKKESKQLITENTNQ